ncbi:hypothetical protein [Streptomyces sp. rh34]|uniref:hypothetical protein n=1 Tax=Streptomyces sp. rh34 TaxID=2034272 RepID=UPI000BEF7A71|nr:hypothetical protein [Streptomyces sp. rh34]
MRTRTAAAAILLGAALTACGTTPTPDRPATTSSAPELSKTETLAQCVDAIAEAISARPADFDPETDSDPKPPECDDISEDEYLDVYMDGLQQSNEQ